MAKRHHSPLLDENSWGSPSPVRRPYPVVWGEARLPVARGESEGQGLWPFSDIETSLIELLPACLHGDEDFIWRRYCGMLNRFSWFFGQHSIFNDPDESPDKMRFV
jgi:hypothetical protein